MLAGKGTVIYKSGDKYEGDWREDTRHGLGTLWVYKEGKYRVRYHGNWVDDAPAVSDLLCGELGPVVQLASAPWGARELVEM